MKWSIVLSSARVLLVQTLGHLKVVLAPFLFSLYTVECRTRSTDESCTCIKFADDTELDGKNSNDEDALCNKQTENFVNWCDKNYLHLNVSKIKEMCVRTSAEDDTFPREGRGCVYLI